MSAGPSPSLRARLALPAWLALGLAVRVALACSENGTVGAAESDGFVRAWVGWQRGDLNRLRPPGWLALLDLLGRVAGRGSELGLRLGCVALSLVALGCALVLVSVLAGAERRRSAAAWLAAAWALSPTLIEAGVRPVAASATAACVCLALAAVVAWHDRPSGLRWLGVAASLASAVLVGGSPVAVAAVVALLVFLLPLPPLRRAGPLVAAVLVAGVTVWFVGRAGPDRPVQPEGSAAESLLVLMRAASNPTIGLAVHPDHRVAQAFQVARDALQDAGPAACARRLGERCVAELLGPSRLQRPAGAPIAAFDVLLFAAAAAGSWFTLRRARRHEESGWPRAGLVAGLLVLFLFSAATACDAWALAPVLLALAGCAAPALAQAGWRRALTRALIVAVAVTVVLVPLATLVTPRGWDWMTARDPTEGPALVALLADGGPRDLASHLECAALMTDPAAPFLRLPEAAVAQSQAAVVLAPDDPLVLLAAARSHAEALDFEGARALASSVIGNDGLPVPKARVTLDAVGSLEKRLRTERLP